MKEIDREIINITTKGELNQPTNTSKNDIISEKENEKVNSFYEEQKIEFINRDIPVNINDISEIRTKSNLSLDQERIIQKLPNFR